MRNHVAACCHLVLGLLIATPAIAQLPPIERSGRTGPRAMSPGAAPANLVVAASGPRTVRLSWTAPAGATGYIVSRAETAAGPFTALTGVPITTSAYLDPTVTPQRKYVYRVSARYADKLDGVTAPASVATPCDAYCAKASCAPPPASILDVEYGSIGSGPTWQPTIKVTARDAATGALLPGTVTVNDRSAPLGQTLAYPACRTRGPNSEIVVCRARVTITNRGSKTIIAS